MATFLAGRKLSRIGIDSDRSSISTVLERVRCSVRSISKSSGCKLDGVPVTPRAAPAEGVADRALQVELERVAVLVGLGVVRPLVAVAEAVHLVLTDLVLGQLGEQVAQGVGADRPQPLRRQLEAALLLLDEPGLGEHPGQLGEPLQRAGGVVAEQVADAVHVGLGQGAGVGALRSRFSSWSRSPSSCIVCIAWPMPERVLALEVVGLVPALLREQAAQVPPSWSICQRRSMSPSSWSESSCSCARCSGVIELSIACIAAILWASCSSSSSSVCGFSGKKSPYCSMNSSKRGSSPRSRRSSISLSAAIMSFMRARSSGVICCIAPLICSNSWLASCWRSRSISSSNRRAASGRLEVVLLQLAHLAGEVVGQEVEAHVAVRRRFPRRLGPALVAGALGVRLGLAHGVVDGVALLVDDVVELAGDLVVDAAEVEAVEALLALLAQVSSSSRTPCEPLAVAVAQALVHHPPQGGVDVAVVEQLVGELLEQGVAVELEALLRAVPARVREPSRHMCAPSPQPGAQVPVTSTSM